MDFLDKAIGIASFFHPYWTRLLVVFIKLSSDESAIIFKSNLLFKENADSKILFNPLNSNWLSITKKIFFETLLWYLRLIFLKIISSEISCILANAIS